jgi:DNA-binding NarL/FixJ family response regulator
MNLSFSIPLLISLSVLGLLLLDRTRLQAQIRSLSQHQTNTDSSLNQFMQECERTLEEFSQLCFGGKVLQLPQQNDLRHGLPLSSATPGVVPSITGAAGERATQASTKPLGAERKRQILRLASKGASISEIANQLKMPRGEVDLIVSLNQDVEAVGGKS